MNYARIKAVTRIALGETDSTNSYWTDAEIDAMINDSQLQVATDAPCLLTYKEVATVVGDGRYSLPTDFLQLKEVELDITTSLRRSLKMLSFD